MTPEALLTLLAVAVVINIAIMVVLVVAWFGAVANLPLPSRLLRPVRRRGRRGAYRRRHRAHERHGSADTEEEEAESGPAEDADLDEEGLLSILTDPTTGLDNRLAWDRAVYQENERKRRYGRPVSVVIAELYGLDALAERVGHEAADRLVPAIAEALRRYGRTTDRVARVGHAQFHVLLPETDEVRAINYVERVRQACDLWLESGAVALSLSMGWASPGPDDDIEVAMVMAEDRLLAEHRRNARRAG